MNQEDLMATANFKPPTLDRTGLTGTKWNRNNEKNGADLVTLSEIQMRILGS